MFWDIVVFAILAALYLGGLIGFLLHISQFRRLEKKTRRLLIIAYLTGSIAMIYIAVNFALKLLS